MLKLFTLLTAMLLATAPAAIAAPVKARVPSGIGVLLMSKVPEHKRSPLIIYDEPSLGRITEINPASLPSLSQSIASGDESVPVIVTSVRAGWYRIIYDEGEREGWIEGRSSYQFHRWKELLANREVALIGGLKKEYYLLRKTAGNTAASAETLTKGTGFISLFADGDWIRAMTGSRSQGWLRWRDDNSRLVISLQL